MVWRKLLRADKTAAAPATPRERAARRARARLDRAVLEELEPRILMSADLAPLVADGAPAAQGAATPPAAQESTQVATLATQATQASRVEVAVIDGSVPDADALIASLQAQASDGRTLLIIRLDASQDGLAQIDAALKNLEGISALHLFTHGDGEGLQIGSTRLTAANLADHLGDISGWSRAFAGDADLLLYGCDLASTDAGRQLADQLGLLTGTDVAASSDKTGSALLGGDWELEYRQGRIETATFEATEWRHILPTVSFQDGVGGYTGTEDTFLEMLGVVNNNSADTVLYAGRSTTHDPFQILFKFNDIIGVGAGQIPPGSVITSVTLTLTITEQAAFTNPTLNIYRMLAAWSDTSTYASMGDGVDGGEYRGTADASLAESGNKTYTVASNAALIASVQAWVNDPSSNQGWYMYTDGNSSKTGFASSEVGTVAQRPMLTVTYTAPTPPSLDLDGNNSSGGTGNNYNGSYTEGGSAAITDAADATITAGSTANMSGMTVTLTNRPNGTSEVLSATTGSTGITASYNSATGVLTLSGTTTAANYQQVLRTLSYSNSSDNPDTTARSISVVLTDAVGQTASATSTISVTAVNDAPVLGASGGSAAYTENGAGTAVDGGLTVSDADHTNLTGAVVQITGNYANGQDTLNFTNQNGITGSWDAATGTLTLSGAATVAQYQAALRSITYSNSSDTPSTLTRTVSFRTSDGSANSNTVTRTVTVAAVNDAPVVSTSGGSAAYTENGAAVAVDGSVTVSDADHANLSGATVQITGNYVNGQDTLNFTTQNGITGSWNATTGTLTLSGAATVAQYQAALRSITYANSSENPSTATRTVSFSVSDGSASSTAATRTVTVAAVNDAPVITSNGGGASASVSTAENGTAVTTVTATDAEGSGLTYTIVGGADSALFTINSSTGALSFASAPSFESPLDAGGNNVYDVIVQVSDGTLTDTQSLAITVTDVDEFDVGAVTDSNGAANSVAENAANGSTVGLTASASDADGSNNTISYSLSNDAGGRFTINSSTGVVTVANSSLLNYESATSHSITVLATSADGSTSSQSFTINLTDVDEFDVGTVTDSNGVANSVAENAANGSTVGITASASDADATTNTITYSLTNNAGGRFTINSSTGVVTVADGTLLNYEAATSHSITVLATSADGSTSSQSFTINLTDADEFDVGAVTDSNGAANSVAENAANGSTVGITASATDADGSNNTISYSLSDNAGGRFTINSATGVVTVANGSLLNYESATSHSITVLATSADGSTSSQSFTINLTDVDEFDVGTVTDSNGAANSAAENAANGSTVGITASASDADATNNTISYSLTDNAGGRFTINSSTGVVTVADGTLLNFESAASHNITVRATSSDGSFSTQTFTVNLTDVDEFDVGTVTDSNGAANSVAENAANGSTVGVTASATDADGSNNTISYSLSDNAGGRFTINSATGVVTVANGSLLNFEAATSHSITVLATSADGSTSSQSFTINIADVDEFNVGPVSDTNPATNTLDENAANGTVVGITASASDADGSTNTITYSLSDDAGGRFTINSATGVVTVANGSALDYESATGHTITVLATSADGSTSSESFTINLTDVDEFDVGSITDADAAANAVSEAASDGDAVGLTASASDLDATNNTITYTLTDDAGGRFTIDASTGVVTIADSDLLDYETSTSHLITVRAESSDGSFSTQTFTINVLDSNEAGVGPVSDTDGGANQVAENAANGSTVGITALATDADLGDSVSYSLSDNAGGRFTINASTGVVTVANSGLLDREAAASHSITVVATSTDGSSTSRTFTINLLDVDEFDVGTITDNNAAANQVAENAANGSLVGLTARATDADATTNTITYSLSDNAGGRFAINATTGVVTVANGSLLDREAAASHGITVVATSSDGSSNSQSFTINLVDVNEFDLGALGDSNAAANTVNENAANGSTVGLTALAVDADATQNTVTYSLTDNAGGRFSINSATGVVTVANGSLLNFESATSHSITVLATSADGSTSSQSFTINIADVDEFDVGAVTDTNGAANTLAENAANGSLVGITASASDADGTTNTITYSLSDSASGRFTINGATGVVTVANGSLLDFESATSHTITVLATSADGSTSSQSFTINLTDVDEFDVGAITDSNVAANSVAENATNGSTVGLTASATDADGSNNTITYTLFDDAGGRFAINSSTGVVTVADGSLLDFEAAASHTIIVQATSADGSISSQSFTINLADADEFDVGAVSDSNAAANGVAENAANGSTVGITASATDADGSNNTVTYSLTDNAGGRFTINSATGVVTVANSSALDYESATSHTITVLATSADGSTSSESFTINLTDVDEYDVGAVTDGNVAANSVAENATNGSTVGLTANASDADGTNNTITYSLTDDAGGRFAIDSSTGVVTVVNASLLDFEAATSHVITVRADSSDGSTSSQSFTIQVGDIDEYDVGPVSDTNGAANTIAENTANGSVVGITASASDADGSNNTITYTLSNNAGGRFAIDSSTGVVTVADDSLLNYEAATSHTITVLATSADGSTRSRTFTINLTDVDEFDVGAVTDSNAIANEVAENVATGSLVGITAAASDADGSNNAITYTLSDDAGGRFAINSSTGVVTVLDGSLLDFEDATSHSITVLATSSDGSSSSQSFTINLADVDEFDVGPVSDTDAAADSVAENAANGSSVGITASATDADGTNHTISYTLTDNAGGRFTIDTATGVVTVADSSLLDFETATSHSITVLATSADGSTSSRSFTITLTDVDEFDVSPIADSAPAADSVGENAANGSLVGITASASDADATTSTVTYSLTDDAGGRFAIDVNTGVVTVADGSLLDFEAATSHTITVRADSADGSFSTRTFTIALADVDEFDIGPVADTDATAEQIDENAANGASVGITAGATDADGTNNAVTYTLADDAGGRFAIDAATGVVTVADSSLLDFEAATSHTITVLATSADGSTSSRSFTIALADVDEFDVGPITDTNAAANAVGENATAGSTVGITAGATDGDATNSTVTYALSDDAGGRFTIDATTGVVTVLDGSLLDFEAQATHTITVVATSADGSSSMQSYTIGVRDLSEAALGPLDDTDTTANQVAENAARGSVVGITALASDPDVIDSVSYSLLDNAGGRFTIDAATGVVRVASGDLLDFETAKTHQITILATSTDGSTRTETFTIVLTDVAEGSGPIGTLPDPGTPPGGNTGTGGEPESPPTPTQPTMPDEPDPTPEPGPGRTEPEDAGWIAPPADPMHPADEGALYGSGHASGSASGHTLPGYVSGAVTPSFYVLSQPANTAFALAKLIQPDWGAATRLGSAPLLLGSDGANLAPPTIQWEGEPGTGFAGGPLLAQGIQVSGVALSVGVVWWATRLTGLLAGLVATTPAWRTLDPLPVLGNPDDDEDDDAPGDGGDEAAELFDAQAQNRLPAHALETP